eukprot:5069717-Amphidinium_carterae.1
MTSHVAPWLECDCVCSLSSSDEFGSQSDSIQCVSIAAAPLRGRQFGSRDSLSSSLGEERGCGANMPGSRSRRMRKGADSGRRDVCRTRRSEGRRQSALEVRQAAVPGAPPRRAAHPGRASRPQMPSADGSVAERRSAIGSSPLAVATGDKQTERRSKGRRSAGSQPAGRERYRHQWAYRAGIEWRLSLLRSGLHLTLCRGSSLSLVRRRN